MIVRVQTSEIRLFLPVPARMIVLVIRMLPARVIEDMHEKTPEPYREVITKEAIVMLVGACMDVLKENKGLEIIHVEIADGTFVSIRL